MNAKKIIAREGLIILGVIILSALFFGIEDFLPQSYQNKGFVLIGAYFLYLLIYFILWAIKTLRAK